MSIPLNISTILQGKTVESERLEFKKSWNPTAIMRTVGAFANDFENLGSGYIVVGIEEENGMPKRPVWFSNRGLRLTECKGTGIPTIRKALENNGSQPAYFDTDGVDRRFFYRYYSYSSRFYSSDNSTK